MFSRRMLAGWGDMDFNGHMRNTAYLDRAADLRMLFFSEHGFPAVEFRRRQLGPVVRRDGIEYRAEIGLLEEFTVTLTAAGLSPDGSRFALRNRFERADGKLAALLTSTGGWLDLKRRRLTLPPAELLEALRLLPRTEDFRELPAAG